MSAASNRLPILQAQAREMHKAVGQYEGEARAALGAGAMLTEAKGLCRHGEWLPWLQAAGIPERSAQRYMLLHRAGFKSATVADIGFTKAERYASTGLKLLPESGHVTFSTGRKDSDRGEFRIFWAWRHTDDLAGFGIVTSELGYLRESRPACIWGLGAAHESLMADLHLDRPFQTRFDGVPGGEAILAKFTSLDPWPA